MPLKYLIHILDSIQGRVHPLGKYETFRNRRLIPDSVSTDARRGKANQLTPAPHCWSVPAATFRSKALAWSLAPNAWSNFAGRG